MKLKKFIAATAIVAGTVGFAGIATATDGPHKVFVCKYVGTPFVDERLQTGDNPISVDIHSLDGPPVIGQFFTDQQGRSVVIAFDTGQPEPSVSECPTPPPTTTLPPVTTQPPTTTVPPSITVPPNAPVVVRPPVAVIAPPKTAG